MRILVIGSFSGGNYGDSLVLSSIIHAVQDELDGIASFIVPTPRPAHVESLAHVEAVDINMRRRFTYRFFGPDVLRTAASCQAVLTTAGILFDRSLFDPRVSFIGSALPVLQRARRHRAVVFGLNVGVTPPTGFFGKQVLGATLRAHDAIATRDHDSAQLVRSLANHVRVRECADMAHISLCAVPAALDPGGGGDIGFNFTTYLTSFDGATGRQSKLTDRKGASLRLAGLIDEVHSRTGRGICFVATSIGDHLFHEDLARWVRAPISFLKLYATPMEEGFARLRSLSMLVGSRLHACIVASGLGIPTFALAYEPKVFSYMLEVGSERWVRPFKAIMDDALADSILELFDHGAEIGRRTRAETQKRAGAATEGVRMFGKLLRERHG